MRQMLAQVRRWLPGRALIFVADSGYAQLRLLAFCRHRRITVVTRLRLDAGLYAPAPQRLPGQTGRPRKKGNRLPTLAQVADCPETQWQRLTVSGWYGPTERLLDLCTGTAVWYHSGEPLVPLRWVLLRDPAGKFQTQALLCTEPDASPEQVLRWFQQRWQMEVTFQEVRTHLGVETQRQWSAAAIERTTPALLGLFSLVALMADRLPQRHELPVRRAAWYAKQTPTFTDALAAVRQRLWQARGFCASPGNADSQKPPAQFPGRLAAELIQTLAYAA